MLRAVIYARYSSDNQRDESIDAQVRLCKNYIKEKGYALIQIYADEAVSGRTDDRVQFQRMLADAKDGVFDVVVIDAVDRFSRDKYDSALYKRELRKKCGVRIEYASQKIDDTPEGLMLEGILENLAQYYAANLARETMKGLTENALRGWHTGGIPPFGLKLVTHTQDDGTIYKTYDIHPDQAPIVKKIFEIYDAGGTYGEIMTATRDDMIRLRGRPISKNSIYDMLRNEKYTGTFVFGKGSKKEHKRTRPDAIRVPDAFPAIVSCELWERVQAKMDKRRQSPGERAQNKSKRVFLLTGIIYCGKCGAAVVGNSGRGRDKKRRSYYECNVKQRSKECDMKSISADMAEQIAIEDIQKELFSKEGKARLKKQFKKYLAERPKKIKEQETNIRREIAGLDRKITNIVEAVEGGRSSAALLDRLDMYEEHKEDLRLKLLNLEAKEKKPVSMKEVETLLEKAEKEMQDRSDPKRLKDLIRLFTERVTVYEDGIEVKLKIVPPGSPGGGSDTEGSPNGVWVVSDTFYKRRRTPAES
jgi:site-specific DNA recombinase